MAEWQVRRLPVTENGRVVGILTLADIAREVHKREGNRAPACMAVADTLAAISKERAHAAERAQAAE
jgi:signal-transduction protein with cAMP-binding, CBS, and nucleotidyltransferase domain